MAANNRGTSPKLVSSHEMPKKSYVVKRHVRKPNALSDVLLPVLLAIVLGGFLGWAGGVILLAVVNIIFILSGDATVTMTASAFAALGAGIAGMIVLVWRIRNAVDNEMIDTEHTTWQTAMFLDNEPTTPNNLVHIEHNGVTVGFQQPRAGEFANWIEDVLNDRNNALIPFGSKTNLSQNTARKRRWPDDMHADMVKQLKDAGMADVQENRTTTLTDVGAAAIHEWLQVHGRRTTSPP